MRTVMDDSKTNSEVSRAEFHLNSPDSEGPKAGTVGLAVGAFLLLVITKAASAGVLPLDTCSTHLKTLRFAGTFTLKNTKNKPAEPLRFVIGEPEGGAQGMAVAQIWSGNHCQASCSSVGFEKGDQSMPISLDLQCHGEDVGALSAHVAVLWDHGSEKSTLLRFGSWLDGYEQATLKVEVDHFNGMALASRGDLDMPSGKITRLAFRTPGLSTTRIDH